jgi:lipopolysaccharide/colanic/teichoic acid biosynthesis glycosyltransferase
MLLTKLLAVLRRVVRPGAQESLTGLLEPAPFRRLMERERARADRGGDHFALLALTPSGHRAEDMGCLVRILKARLRSGDDVGWLEDRSIGVLLPTTAAPGAWKVAKDVCLRLPANVPPPTCTVYAYPPDSDKGPPGQNGISSLGPRTPAKALESLLLLATPVWKRSIDLVGASIGLVLLLPLFGLIALILRCTSPGPVFFTQLRSGRGGKPFLMYKFRTMVCDAEAQKVGLMALNEQDGPAFKIKHDPRVTAVGRVLRKTSLDELPQLWNVLRGDMSLVGPRPLPCAESEACEGWLRRRLDVTPGLTCLWQVRGRCSVSFADWVRMDLQYIRSRSLWQDLKLLLLTVPVVVMRKGAH